MVLGRYRVLALFGHDPHHPVADKLADAAAALSRECVGALIAIEREMALTTYVAYGRTASTARCRRRCCEPSSPSEVRCTTAR